MTKKQLPKLRSGDPVVVRWLDACQHIKVAKRKSTRLSAAISYGAFLAVEYERVGQAKHKVYALKIVSSAWDTNERDIFTIPLKWVTEVIKLGVPNGGRR